MDRLSNYAASSSEVLPKFLQVEAFAKLNNSNEKCSDKLGLSLELGSFAAGVMISSTDLAQHTLEHICLSKGLGAPVGSVIVGSESFIAKARRLRKTLGGGMRQVGVLTATAFVALKDNVSKLSDDHKKAKILADGLNQIKQFSVDVSAVETNLVFFDVTGIKPEKLCQVLEKHGVIAMPASPTRLRVRY